MPDHIGTVQVKLQALQTHQNVKTGETRIGLVISPSEESDIKDRLSITLKDAIQLHDLLGKILDVKARIVTLTPSLN